MNHLQGLRSNSGLTASKDVALLQALRAEGVALSAPQQQLAVKFVAESIGESDAMQLSSLSGELKSLISGVAASLNFDAGLSDESGASMFGKQRVFAAESAAISAGMIAADFNTARREPAFTYQATDTMYPVAAGNCPDYLGHRSKVLALEAFDTRNDRSAVLYSMAYNYSLARQDAFGETLWPTLTLPADQVGFGIVVNRLTVHRGVTHSTTGTPVNFGKIDLMRAAANHKVLQKERTKILPLVRANNLTHFVDPALIAITPAIVDSVALPGQNTAPLAVNVEHDLIGLSQTDAQLLAGAANQTDTLDPMILLEKIYIRVGDDIIPIRTASHGSANFVAAPQGVDRQSNLQFISKAIPINGTTVQADGTALTDLAVVTTKSLQLVLSVTAGGYANLETGFGQVFGTSVKLLRVKDEDGVTLPETDADVIALRVLFNTASLIAYDVRAWKSNMNMRERGDFIDRTSFTQLYEIPLLSPVTAQRPQSSDGSMEAGDFEALVTTTRFRLQNDAVTALQDAFTEIHGFASRLAGDEDVPSLLGAARFHVKPKSYDIGTLDFSAIVDSLTSSDRAHDLQQAIVNVLRDYAFKMYVESEYPAAQAALGMTDQATLIVATDPYIHRWLMVEGDLRTLTEKFNVRIVSSLDSRMAGQLYMVFGVFDENRNQAPNILNFGNLVWAPESVMSASVPRGESMSKETIVQPRYRFIWHCPIIAKATITGIPQLFSSKLAISVNNTVTP